MGGYEDPVKYRARQLKFQKAKQARWRERGLCIACGLPTPLNKYTGQPSTLCFTHKLRSAANYAKRAAARRAQGGA